MAEPSGDRSHINARRQKARRYVVPEVMEPNARDPSLLADPPKRSRGRIGMPWRRAVDCMAEDEVLGVMALEPAAWARSIIAASCALNDGDGARIE